MLHQLSLGKTRGFSTAGGASGDPPGQALLKQDHLEQVTQQGDQAGLQCLSMIPLRQRASSLGKPTHQVTQQRRAITDTTKTAPAALRGRLAGRLARRPAAPAPGLSAP